LVEQRTENPCVPGSIPGGTTKKSEHFVRIFCFLRGFSYLDEDNDDLMITDVSSDGSGTVAINADTISIDYTPEANFNGNETIS
jgi:hypothetical protein